MHMDTDGKFHVHGKPDNNIQYVSVFSLHKW